MRAASQRRKTSPKPRTTARRATGVRTRAAPAQEPIRLKVTFKSARALMTEYTTCISRGCCAIRSPRALPLGTRFVFELMERQGSRALELEGEVTRCEPAGPEGQWTVGIRYLMPPAPEPTVEAVLERILAEHEQDSSRRHPRIPVNLVAVDRDNPQRRYLVRDLSRGGLGVRLERHLTLPQDLLPGRRATLTVDLGDGPPVVLRAEIAWTAEARPPYRQASLGLLFPVVGQRHLLTIDALMRLRRPESIVLAFL